MFQGYQASSSQPFPHVCIQMDRDRQTKVSSTSQLLLENAKNITLSVSETKRQTASQNPWDRSQTKNSGAASQRPRQRSELDSPWPGAFCTIARLGRDNESPVWVEPSRSHAPKSTGNPPICSTIKEALTEPVTCLPACKTYLPLWILGTVPYSHRSNRAVQ